MRKQLGSWLIAAGLVACGAIGYAWAQFNPPAGAQIVFPVDNFPIGGPNGATGVQTCSAACLNTNILNPIDATGYSGITIEATSLGGGNIVTILGSNDPGACSAATNWFGTNVYASSISPGAAQPLPTMANTGIFIGPIAARCIRGQITTYSSGTVTVEAFLRYGLPPLYTPYSAVTSVPPYPGNNGTQATPVTCGATGTTGAVTCTLAGTAGKTTYLCGYFVAEQENGTSGNVVTITTTGLTNNFTEYMNVPTSQSNVARQLFTPCVPASAQNTAITVNTNANANATNVGDNAWGFQL